ncbi:unnamed protein product, partial [Ilex paraguariensis]
TTQFDGQHHRLAVVKPYSSDVTREDHKSFNTTLSLLSSHIHLTLTGKTTRA